MRYQVYLEDGIEGRALAWVLAYPGCYNYGATVMRSWSACLQL